MPGDANADGRIDLDDLSVVLNNFSCSGPELDFGEFLR